MEEASGRECLIEVVWRQRASEDWVAVLTERATGEQREARSQAELWRALQSLVGLAPDSATATLAADDGPTDS